MAGRSVFNSLEIRYVLEKSCRFFLGPDTAEFREIVLSRQDRIQFVTTSLGQMMLYYSSDHGSCQLIDTVTLPLVRSLKGREKG